MSNLILSERNALVLGVERAAGRKAAIALGEAGASVAVVTLSEATAAEFAANSAANELWAMDRQGIALISDSGETTVRRAIEDATAELGPVRIFVYHAMAPLPAATFESLRSDPAIVVLVDEDDEVDAARALLLWTRELADAGLRANAIVASRDLANAAGPVVKEHQPPVSLTIAAAVVYLTSDASAALEGTMMVAADE